MNYLLFGLQRNFRVTTQEHTLRDRNTTNPKHQIIKGIAYEQKNGILTDQWLELLDELNIGAFTVNLQRSITSMNYAAQALMGLDENEVEGKDCREIFTGVPCLVDCLLRENSGCQTDEPDVEIKDENDRKHILTRLATPIYDPNQNVAGCLTLLQDHSPIVDLIDKIHYEERSNKSILDNLDVGMFTVDRGGHITFFNNEAERISGYSRRELLGKHFTEIFEEDAMQDSYQLKESIDNGSTRSSHHGKITTKDGETIPVRANYMALKNKKNTIVGGLTTFHDLTLIHQLKQAISGRYTFHDMVGKDPTMQQIFEKVSVIAETDATVIIEGATGTGKDLLAKIIHSTSKRVGKPFVKVNCAALPDNLLESEMFGYVKGAFTGADRDKPGRFSEADGGSIFLDEIGDLPLSLQAKLLRVLEDKEFYPLGSRRIKKVDIRIITATNRGLESLVEKKLFREDLYYRLNVFKIELPALKDRRIDLPILIRHILRRLCTASDNRPARISEEAMELLLKFHYPGNVRELENILEHALIICRDDVIRPKHFPDYMQHLDTPSEPENLSSPITGGETDNAEKQHILKVLRQNNWQRSKTAQVLEMDRTTLWRKMKRHGINR
ncbi:MAG: sigma 54-interacting transcriptional regulator [Deltaproteobacteria bacterium]|nr:sigma 54-interacting transcriptional regulator [Deltaproteobacteria bacterium]